MDFKAPYERQAWLDFFQNQLLPDDFKRSDEKIAVDFKPDRIRSCLKIADVPSLDLTILEIEHESENDPRVSLSRETFRLLANYGKQRALALFISKNSENYRLSLVTIDLKWEEGKRPTKEYSNPRRLSFFLGPDAKIHTPQEYLVKPGRVNNFDDLKRRFSIEVVTKEFYEEYAEVFAQIESAIAKNNKLNKPDLRLYTQMLMNRLMFLRFLEKKKWVKFGESADYLANLYAAGGLNKQSFFITRLCPLFFEALAIEGKQESDAVGKTVFLNGGLFEISELDEKVQDIPDTAFKNLLGPDGLFYKFNFTVEESTPIDVEVSVDPEMLGKVFEELVTGRHETGSYYTPRSIVSFMCKEALKGFLVSKTSASKEAIELLVDEHEIANGLTNRHAEEILFYLETIKAIDPACGSGAYLLGLLQELIEIRKTLQNQQLKSDPDFIYNLKLRLISHCLYGVDIDPFATNIAKLRLWLSLSVEADTPQPLPNLDFKIETGDSILGPCDIYADRPDALAMSALRQRAQQLVLKKDQYMLAHGEEKQKLYDEIVAEERALVEQTGTIVGEGTIAWHIHFAEVFTRGRRTELTFDGQFGFMADAQRQRMFKITSYEPSGFDIVLANPPYGLLNKRQNKKSGYYINPAILQRIKNSHEFGVIFRGMANVCSLFIRRSFSLLSPGGMFVEIFPLSFTCDWSFSYLRQYILSKQTIYSIDAFPERDDPNRRVFYSAKMSVCILLAKRELSTNNPFMLRIHNEPRITKNNNQAIINPTDINLLDTNSSIPLVKQNDIELLKKIYSDSFRLSNIGKCYTGEVDLTLCRKFIKQAPNYAVMHKGAIIDKYRIRESMSQGEIEYLDANAFIRVRGKRKTSSAWHHRKYRIVLQGITGINERIRLKMTLLPPGQFCANSANYILLNNEDITEYLFVLGVLNSKITNYVFKCFSTNSNVNGYEVDNLPIPKTSNTYKQQIVSLVKKCLDAKGIDCEEWEKEIDKMVYKLYGLTSDEVEIIGKYEGA